MSERKDLEKPKNHNGQVELRQMSISAHSGPIPSPQDFAAYESVLRGSADRILSMAEKEQSRREAEVLAAIDFDKRQQEIIKWIVTPIVPLGFVLAAVKGDTASYGILIGELATLVAAFVYSKKKPN